jgi:hypothetical protein
MAVNTAYTANSNTIQPDGPKRKSGRITFPATSITAADYVVVEVGFTPVEVRWVNNTSRIAIEWYEGMAADTCVKTAAAGTRTLETTNKGITICDSDGTANTAGRYFKVAQNATLAAILASEVCNWVALG